MDSLEREVRVTERKTTPGGRLEEGVSPRKR